MTFIVHKQPKKEENSLVTCQQCTFYLLFQKRNLIEGILNNPSILAYIGARDIPGETANSHKFIYSGTEIPDGDELWGQDQPSEGGNPMSGYQDCVTTGTVMGLSGLWTDYCDREHMFVCEKVQG